MKQKRLTTQQRFDKILKDVDAISAASRFDAEQTIIARNAVVHGIRLCVKEASEVHLSGGDAGAFMNEIRELCANHVMDFVFESAKKACISAESITDQIVKPEEN